MPWMWLKKKEDYTTICLKQACDRGGERDFVFVTVCFYIYTHTHARALLRTNPFCYGLRLSFPVPVEPRWTIYPFMAQRFLSTVWESVRSFLASFLKTNPSPFWVISRNRNNTQQRESVNTALLQLLLYCRITVYTASKQTRKNPRVLYTFTYSVRVTI